MRFDRACLLVLVPCFAATFGACGGKAVFDGQGGGRGTGGAGGSTSDSTFPSGQTGTTTSTNGTSVATTSISTSSSMSTTSSFASTTVTSASSMVTTVVSSSTGIDPTLCQSLCATLNMFGCEVPSDCDQQCDASLNGPCSGFLADYYQCYLDTATSCTPSEQCFGPLDAYTNCINGGGNCGDVLCSGGGGGGGEFCQCTADCDIGNVAVSCKSSNGMGTCECMQNGSVIGTCNETNPSCDPFSGCCAGVFGFGFDE